MRRSKHSLSHYHLTTLDLGQLVPISMVPVLPGDTIGHHTNMLIRVSPLAAPVMHQVDARVDHFYVAYRTIWNDDDGTDWEEFITGGEDGYNQDVVPTITTTDVAKNLLDHFGVPPVSGIDISALPVRAFNAIFNEFYRDQDLVAKRDQHDLTIPNIAWGKDYKTAARPWAQKGPQVSIPLGSSAPIYTDAADATAIGVRRTAGGGSANGNVLNSSGSNVLTSNNPVGADADNLYADLSQATGADPVKVREAWGLQRFMEFAARFGSRYPEKMRALGSRYQGLMDRPEFLGRGSQSVNFSEVLQTANDAADRAFGVGDMYGHGIAALRSGRYARRIDEHGCIISCLSVRPSNLYQDGIDREWLRKDREDFHDPFLEFVGQQEVWDNEVWADGSDPQSTGVFGYSDKYQEYRGMNSHVTSEFRNTLDYWHMARKFQTKPALNEEFINCVPSKRIFNEQNQDSLWVMAHHKISAHRNIAARADARLF